MSKKKPHEIAATLKADDGAMEALIEIKVTDESAGLQPDELEAVLRSLIRDTTRVLEKLPYTNFGVEGMTITRLSRKVPAP